MIHPLERKKKLDKFASEMSGAVRTKDGVMIPIEHGFYHVTDILDINCEGYEKYGNAWHYYQPICNADDIERILNPKNSSDLLLGVRANTVLDKPRLLRVFRTRFNNSPNLSISSYYEKNDKNTMYLQHLSKGNRAKLIDIPAGSALIDRMNAACIKTEFGNMIVVSEALEYFLYYMNIFIYGKNIGFDISEAYVALIIGLRIYFGYEALDFDLDPRGDFPYRSQLALSQISSLQYSFILGHEYSHHLLGHLSDQKLKSEYFFKDENGQECNLDHYIHRFKEEYDADWHAIKNVKGSSNFKSNLANAAFTSLLSMHAAKRVNDYMHPRGSNGYSSHPEPVERIWKIRSKLDNRIGFDKEMLESTLEYVNNMVDHFLKEHLPYHFDDFERYGSYYFAKYKGPLKRDRFDF